MAKKSEQIKCPWCGRMVGFSKGSNVMPHLGPGGVRCVAGGQPKHQVLAQMELSEQCRKERG